MIRYLPLILKNGLRNRRRSLLTIASIGASMCLLGFLMAMYHAFFFGEASAEGSLRLVTRNRISLATVMPISYQAKIKTIPGVKEIMVYQWFGGVYKEPKNMFARFAVEPDKLFTVYPEFKIPEDQKLAFQRERTACIVGRKLAERFNLKLGDRMTLVGDIFPVNLDFYVRGIYDAAENNEIMYFHLQYLFDSLGPGRKDFAGTFATIVNSPEDVTRVGQAIDEMFRNATAQTRTETERNFALSFLSFLGNIKMILLSICAAVTFTIILVCANTMAMSVRERVKEVGVLKTLGFTNGAILTIILGEAAFISLLGGILGWIIANGLAAGVRQLPAFIDQLATLTIQPPVTVALLVISVLIGVASSFIPAYKASKTTILDALRYNG
jgi:putative ABC transport system permease protein